MENVQSNISDYSLLYYKKKQIFNLSQFKFVSGISLVHDYNYHFLG